MERISQQLYCMLIVMGVVISQPSLSAYSLPIGQTLVEEFAIEPMPIALSPLEIVSRKIEQETISEGPFFIIDLGALVRQYNQWCLLLPRVKPFYAAKCNPEPALIKVLAQLGAGFDCASAGEIARVVSYGVAPERIIMANPCKPASHIKIAQQLGVKRMTFDNVDELYKIKKTYPEAELVLRILPDDSHSMVPFGIKFGAATAAWRELLTLAMNLNLNVVGISFHVGSGCMSVQAFTDALRLARAAFDTAACLGMKLSLLDIGGGFPGLDTQTISFRTIANAIRPLLDDLFGPEIEIVAEPGRYMAQQTHILATTVYARREQLDQHSPESARYLYYINDGVYGSFNCIFFDHAHPAPLALNKNVEADLYPSNVFGPTCDSLDLVCKNYPLPQLDVGDWLVFPAMGAYTVAASSAFNGFKNKISYYVYTL